jgi:hypothetical protein
MPATPLVDNDDDFDLTATSTDIAPPPPPANDASSMTINTSTEVPACVIDVYAILANIPNRNEIGTISASWWRWCRNMMTMMNDMPPGPTRPKDAVRVRCRRGFFFSGDTEGERGREGGGGSQPRAPVFLPTTG